MYNILIIGPTGVGKSTLLNKIVNQELAKVGHAAKPETLKLDDYPLTDKITLWDSPGLGEDIHKEKQYKKELKKILDKHNFIDIILIVVDSKSSKENTTISNLVNFIVALDKSYQNKFIFIMNKVDEAKSFKYWDVESNKPTQILKKYISDFKQDYSLRLSELTGIKISLFLHCSTELDYNLHTISNSLYHYILNKHIRDR